MTRFHDLMSTADEVIDSVHAEAWRLQPMLSGQYAGRQPDATRPEVDFSGVLVMPAEARDAGLRPELTARQPRLHVMDAQIASAEIRPGDRVIRLGDGQAFEVRAIRIEGMTRTVLELAAEDSA